MEILPEAFDELPIPLRDIEPLPMGEEPLLFHIVPENSTHTALLLAGGFALTGAVVSITRIRLPLPEGLTRRRK